MFSYESGVAVAAMLWLYSAISLLVTINSTLERNLNRIGQRVSWLTRRPKPLEAEDQTKSLFSKVLKFTIIFGLSFPFIFLSWVYVALALAQVAYGLSKDFGAPQLVREFRWKMKNADLTFDQIVKELIKFESEGPENFDAFRANIINEMRERGLHCR